MSDDTYSQWAAGPERRFEITGGLREGYGDTGTLHRIEEVRDGHHAWQATRHLILGITITPAEISYGWPDGDSTHCECEPGFIASGVMHVKYAANVPDDVARRYVENLTSWLAVWLGQLRIYYTFMGQAFILERDGATMPTPDP